MASRPTQPNTPALRKALRTAISKSGMSMTEVARRAGINKGTLSHVLNFRVNSVRDDYLQALEEVLDVDLFAVAQQTRLQLPIAENFLSQAIEAIDEHILSADPALHTGVELVGGITLSLRTRPRTRTFAKRFVLQRGAD